MYPMTEHNKGYSTIYIVWYEAAHIDFYCRCSFYKNLLCFSCISDHFVDDVCNGHFPSWGFYCTWALSASVFGLGS